MTFQNTHLFFLLIFLIPAGYFLWTNYYKTLNTLKIFSEKRSDVRRRSIVISILFLAYLTSIVIVSFGPQRYIVSPEQEQTGNFLFLIDVSRSMAARTECSDFMPFDNATSLMAEIVNEIPEAGFAFAAYSELSFPLSEITYDRQYLLEIIENGLYIEVVPVPGSDIGNAFLVILEKKQDQPQIFSKIEYVILMSDGDISEQVNQDLVGIMPQLRNAGIHVISIGIGSEDANPIPTIDESLECVEGQYERAEGREFYTHLFEEPLRFIAEETNGRYFYQDDQGELIDYLKSTLVTTPGIEPPVQTEDISYIFLIIATIALFGLIWMQRY